jgi:hypothetical protein
MGSQSDHIAKWKHNRSFLATIQDAHCDWMVTVAFYAAVHAVEALFAKDQAVHEGTHNGRNDLLKRRPRYQSIWRVFRPPFEASRAARYDCCTGPHPTAGWVTAEDVKAKFIGQFLDSVERTVIQLLSISRADFPPLFPTALPHSKESTAGEQPD